MKTFADVLSSELDLPFQHQEEEIVSYVISDMYTYKVAARELDTDNDTEVVIELSVTPSYTEELLFDFRGMLPRCYEALFALQSHLPFGRLELHEVGNVLTVSLRHKERVFIDPDPDADFTPEEVSADAVEHLLDVMLNQMFSTAALLRQISLTGLLPPQTTKILTHELKNHALIFNAC